MRKIAPSIFATEAHESRSDRFVPVPTIEVLRGLKKEGFDVVGVKQSNTRDEGKVNFTKHLIRLRRVDGEKYKVGDTVAEMLLKNANDGTCQYELMAGLFRILCLNSLVAQKAEIESIKVRHSGNHQGYDYQGYRRYVSEWLTKPRLPWKPRNSGRGFDLNSGRKANLRGSGS